MLGFLKSFFGREFKAPNFTLTRGRPAESGDLSAAEVKHMQDTATCPYCKSDLYTGPRGGAAVNMFCGNRDCNSRFNIADPEIAPIPWGQFMGECPDDFWEAIKAMAAGSK